MEEPPEDREAQVSEPWLSKWERQCLAEAEEEDRLSPELQEGTTADAAALRVERQRLWQLFQISATAVAQLYKDSGCQQAGPSMWDPFQNAAMAVTSLYKESGDAYQRSFELGVQVGYQRRIRDVLEWVKKGRSVIRREDLIGFLCGKSPPTQTPTRPSRVAPKPPAAAASQVAASESGPSVDSDLQPFHEAIALHGLNGAMANISVRSAEPGSPTPDASLAAHRKATGPEDDEPDSLGSEELPPHPDSGVGRKRTSAQCGSDPTDSPSHKRNRMV